MTHEHLGLQGLDGLKGNTDNDDDGRAADAQRLHTGDGIAGNDGQQGHNGQINGAKEGNLLNHLGNEVRGGLTRAEARDEAAVLLQVVGISMGSY